MRNFIIENAVRYKIFMALHYFIIIGSTDKI